MNARSLVASTAAAVLVAAAPPANARGRPRFEPTDLELQEPGTTELDLQFGATAGSGGRLLVPDYEINVGLLPRLEFDLDGAFSVVPIRGGSFASTDPLWTSAKLGILDDGDDDGTSAIALGVQLGPRLPLATGIHGVGYEALGLFGITAGRLHLVMNTGLLVDPAATGTRRRPFGVIGGVDVDLDLDAASRWSLVGEVGIGLYLSEYPQDLNVTAGLAWAPSASLELSLIGLVTPVGGHDVVGALFGISPRLARW